jgi:hypothetical protein
MARIEGSVGAVTNLLLSSTILENHSCRQCKLAYSIADLLARDPPTCPSNQMMRQPKSKVPRSKVDEQQPIPESRRPKELLKH